MCTGTQFFSQALPGALVVGGESGAKAGSNNKAGRKRERQSHDGIWRYTAAYTHERTNAGTYEEEKEKSHRRKRERGEREGLSGGAQCCCCCCCCRLRRSCRRCCGRCCCCSSRPSSSLFCSLWDLLSLFLSDLCSLVCVCCARGACKTALGERREPLSRPQKQLTQPYSNIIPHPSFRPTAFTEPPYYYVTMSEQCRCCCCCCCGCMLYVHTQCVRDEFNEAPDIPLFPHSALSLLSPTPGRAAPFSTLHFLHCVCGLSALLHGDYDPWA